MKYDRWRHSMKKFSRCQNWDFWPVQPHCWMEFAQALKIGLQELWQHQINQFQSFSVTWGLFQPFWPLLAFFCPTLKIVVYWSCDHSKRSQDEQISDGDCYGCYFFKHPGHFRYFGPFLTTFGLFLPQTQNCRKLVMWPLKTTAIRAELRWRWFRMSFLCL